jgi:hypothetical protein
MKWEIPYRRFHYSQDNVNMRKMINRGHLQLNIDSETWWGPGILRFSEFYLKQRGGFNLWEERSAHISNYVTNQNSLNVTSVSYLKSNMSFYVAFKIWYHYSHKSPKEIARTDVYKFACIYIILCALPHLLFHF